MTEASSNNLAYTALVTSIFYNYESVTKVIIDRTRFLLDTQGRSGNTILMWACYFGRYEIAEYLLNSGASTDILNTEGDTAKSLADKNGYIEIANLLIGFGSQ